MTIDAAAGPPGRAGMQTLVRAFSILEVLASASAGIGLRDLSRRAGLHKSTTFRIVRTLAELGYVRQMTGSRHYCLNDRLTFSPAGCDAGGG